MSTGFMALLIGFGIQELLIILVIVLVLFGATRVPQLMRGLGQGVREFRDAVKPDPEKEQPPAEVKTRPDEEQQKN